MTGYLIEVAQERWYDAQDTKLDFLRRGKFPPAWVDEALTRIGRLLDYLYSRECR